MFGNVKPENLPLKESLIFHPASPYGVSKAAAHWLTVNYRESHNLFAACGILFNHESPRRGINFVTQKIVIAAVNISLGNQNTLELGNIDSYRDWGHSWDYVRGMWKIINSDDDYVLATGKTHSVRDMCEYVFGRLGLYYKDYVTQNTAYMRAEELPFLRGNPEKARKDLRWEPEYSFEMIMDEMIEYWQGCLKKV
jgi:GDPmannose 4,6-dehydratase